MSITEIIALVSSLSVICSAIVAATPTPADEPEVAGVAAAESAANAAKPHPSGRRRSGGRRSDPPFIFADNLIVEDK